MSHCDTATNHSFNVIYKNNAIFKDETRTMANKCLVITYCINIPMYSIAVITKVNKKTAQISAYAKNLLRFCIGSIYKH